MSLGSDECFISPTVGLADTDGKPRFHPSPFWTPAQRRWILILRIKANYSSKGLAGRIKPWLLNSRPWSLPRLEASKREEEPLRASNSISARWLPLSQKHHLLPSRPPSLLEVIWQLCCSGRKPGLGCRESWNGVSYSLSEEMAAFGIRPRGLRIAAGGLTPTWHTKKEIGSRATVFPS